MKHAHIMFNTGVKGNIDNYDILESLLFDYEENWDTDICDISDLKIIMFNSEIQITDIVSFDFDTLEYIKSFPEEDVYMIVAYVNEDLIDKAKQIAKEDIRKSELISFIDLLYQFESKDIF